jgi:hypothetical protein
MKSPLFIGLLPWRKIPRLRKRIGCANSRRPGPPVPHATSRRQRVDEIYTSANFPAQGKSRASRGFLDDTLHASQ